MKVMEPSPIVTQLVRRDGCRIYWPGVLIASVASTVVCLVGQVGLLLLKNTHFEFQFPTTSLKPIYTEH